MGGLNRTLHRRSGFTLVELVIVVLILGILAAVAAPRMFDTASSARTSATRQSLGVVRNAIELYRAQYGSYPGQSGSPTDFKTEIRPFLQGPFPTCEVGVSGTTVRIESGASALTPGGTSSWAFNSQTGQFIVDHSIGADW